MDDGLKYDDIEKLVAEVKKGSVEIEMELEPTRQCITIRPWKPFEYKCPYKEGNDG